MLKAYESLNEFERKDDKSFFKWLCGIARNRILHLARQRLRSRELFIERDVAGQERSVSTGLRREERFDRLQAALAKLRPEHRQVVILARIEGLSLKEIGGLMERTPKAVSKLLRRALESLRTHFGDTQSLTLPYRNLSEKASDSEQQ